MRYKTQISRIALIVVFILVYLSINSNVVISCSDNQYRTKANIQLDNQCKPKSAAI